MLCCFCGLTFKSEKAVKAHVWRSHTAAGLEFSANKAGRQSKPNYRKGLTKETSDEIRRTSEKVKMTLQEQVKNGSYVARRMSEAARKKLSLEQSLNNRGGKCKWFEYKGQKLQGTWEFNIAKKLDELDIDWYKPKLHRDVWQYTLDGKLKSYTPDLYLPQHDIYLEIKGYWWGNDKNKMTAVVRENADKKLLIIQKEEYEKIMQGELVW